MSRTQVVPGAGAENAGVLFVGEAPGAREDRLGVPFVGASGKLLDEMLQVTKLDRARVVEGEPLEIDYSGAPLRLYPLLHPAAVLRHRTRLPAYEARFRRLGGLLESAG